jgi:hypothetical protein
MAAIEVAAHEDPESGTGPAARLLGKLQRHGLERDDIVGPDRALLLVAEHGVEVDARARDEGRLGIRGRVGELGVVGGDELVAEIGVGRRHGGDPQPLPLLDEAVLERLRCRRSLRPRAWGE